MSSPTPDPLNDPSKRKAVIAALILVVVAIAALLGVKAEWPNDGPVTQPTPTPSVTPTTASPTTASPTPVPLRPSWQTTGSPVVTFSDEFNDTVVDPKKWEKGWFGEGLTQPTGAGADHCYHSDQVSESGGYLHLLTIAKANFCRDATRPYQTGMVTTRGKFSQRTGMFEARVCVNDLNGDGQVDNWPAFWANGMASGFQDGEIDLLEGLGGRTKNSVHYVQANGTLFRGGQYTPTAMLGCHNWGAEYRGNEVVFYVDGVKRWTHEFITVANAQLVLILNQAVDADNGPVYVPAAGSDLKVDWVRAWN